MSKEASRISPPGSWRACRTPIVFSVWGTGRERMRSSTTLGRRSSTASPVRSKRMTRRGRRWHRNHVAPGTPVTASVDAAQTSRMRTVSVVTPSSSAIPVCFALPPRPRCRRARRGPSHSPLGGPPDHGALAMAFGTSCRTPSATGRAAAARPTFACEAAHYRHLASLREYVLVSQRERRIEVRRRNEAGRLGASRYGASTRFLVRLRGGFRVRCIRSPVGRPRATLRGPLHARFAVATCSASATTGAATRSPRRT